MVSNEDMRNFLIGVAASVAAALIIKYFLGGNHA